MIKAVAAVAGLLAHWLKQPLILGYLVAGILLGPFTPGPIADIDSLRFLTEIGVALLLFVMGAGMAPERFRQVGKVVIAGGLLQTTLIVCLGLALQPLFGFDFKQSILLGAILAQSSSAVIIKVLESRGESESLHGRIAVGMSVIQDVTSAPLLLILLVFFGETPQSAGAITLAIGEVFGIAAVTYILGRLVWPRILEWVSRFGTGEITLLATLALALGGAVAVNALGLSFAVGAFLAGLVVAGSSYKQEAISRILPLRDVFTALFFVSIGVFLNPTIIVDEPWLFMGLLGAVILAKGLISAGVVSIFRYPGRTAILSGFLLAQMGEFAFVLAIIGLDRGVVDESFFSLVIAVAIVSIGANSLLLDSTSPMLTVFTKAKEVALRLKPRRGA
ncbi:MAG: cation:proton antiporter [Chloroflexi bacterium]|nr:cation:proton antiporter [Chloroflexota bacterium]